jgi:single-strand DNA-binding protein
MLNKVTLIGNLGADPEIRHMPSGGSVANIRLATTRRWKDKDSGERKEATEWHRVIFFNRLAEIAGEYLKKGSQIYVEGMLQTRSWEKDGQKHYATEIVGREMVMLGGKDTGSKPDSGSKETAPRSQNAPINTAPYPPLPDYGDFDDDINF